jgi:hypothetical protein
MPTQPTPTQIAQGSLDLQEMWGALLVYDWTSLVLVPTGRGMAVQQVVDAFQVVTAGIQPPIQFVDARGVDVAKGKLLAQDVEAALSGASRVVAVVDPLIHSLSGAHLVRCAQAVLLIVRVGAMDLDALTSTVSMVGAERIVGSVTAPVAA